MPDLPSGPALRLPESAPLVLLPVMLPPQRGPQVPPQQKCWGAEAHRLPLVLATAPVRALVVTFAVGRAQHLFEGYMAHRLLSQRCPC